MTQTRPKNTWLALREAAGISQREATKRLGWTLGRLSVIERGLYPEPEEEEQMRRLYAGLLLTDPAANIADVAKSA